LTTVYTQDHAYHDQERELEKVNAFYLLKEAEVCHPLPLDCPPADQSQLKLRLGSLLDQKRLMQAQQTPTAKLSSRYIALEEGFRQFSNDLSKLQVRTRLMCLSSVC
jgi:CDK inhibitor PHO81